MLMMTQVGFVEQFNPLISEEDTQLPDETSVFNTGAGAVYSNSKISTGFSHTCAILDNGSVSCWGSKSNGRMGNGISSGTQLTPTLTSSLGAGRTAIAISVGSAHTCALLDNGSVSCWGYGDNGRLGNGGTTQKNTPTLTSSLGAGRTAVAISSGSSHTCVILDNGSVSCWGEGALGRLGNGGTSDSLTPTLTSSLGPGRTAVAISAKGAHACAILDNGSVSCWGAGTYGKLGNGGTTESLSPTLTSSLGPGRTAVAISTYDKHTCAILDNGSVSCWGYGGAYQLGNGISGSVTTPTLTLSLGANRTAVALATGNDHTCAILDNGSVSCWGNKGSGKLGSGGTTGSQPTPTLTGSLGTGRTAVAIGAGYAHTCVILDNDSASCWGWGGYGQLGNGGTGDQDYPTPVSGSDVFDSSTGSNALTASVEGSALTVDQAMTDITFQYNASSSSSSSSSSSTVFSNSKISAGTTHTCAILDNGSVSCWGLGTNGRLGNGGTGDSHTPTLTSSLGSGRTAIAISSGGSHTCAILDNGSVSCWGAGTSGQLGNGLTSGSLTPTLTSSLGANRTAVAISAGSTYTCALLDNGLVSCWGRGTEGQLGNGGTNQQDSPTLTSSFGAGRTAVAIASGPGWHTCALLDNGSVSCWGLGSNGQLGNTSTSQQNSPTLTSSLGSGRTAVALSSGEKYTCAILDNGSVSCWGKGNDGQLGNGATPTQLTTPTLTSSLGTGRTAVALSSGSYHTCAILDNDLVSCWGRGSIGQLGYGGTSQQNSPTSTSSLGAGRTAVAISSGSVQTCALLDNGSASCWGYNNKGQLGDGTTDDRNIPTLVSSSDVFDNSTGIGMTYITGATCSISPVLPSGITITQGTCSIGGTPLAESSNTTYTVSAILNSVTYQATVWLSASIVNTLTSTVDGADLSLGEAMTPITLNYNAGSSGSTFTNTSGALDTSGNVGTSTSITNDSNGYSHISYFDLANFDLKYATDKSGSWVVTSVDSSGVVGLYTSIAVDSNDDVHISYYDSTNDDLKYATDKSGSWVVSSVDTSGDMGQYTSIAVDSNDDVHISYYDASTDDLKYATDKSGSWVLTSVDTSGDVGYYTSIAVDSNDAVHISYYDLTTTDLNYATDKSGSWVVTSVDTSGDVGYYSSIAVDSNDDVHISYYDLYNKDLKYATDKSGSWVVTSVDTSGIVGRWTSIAVDSNDDVHISYYDATNTDLKYATDKSGSWVVTSVDTSGTVGQYTSIAVDSNDDVHISYYDYTNQDLMYLAMNTGSSSGSSSSAGAVFSNSKIASGYRHSCAILGNGSVACWGQGDQGQLGNGGTATQKTPALVSSFGIGRTAVAISVGEWHSCAILDNGSVSCWGNGQDRALGNGNTTDQLTPTLTSSLGTGRTAVAIAAGYWHTCALLDDGNVSCWGTGNLGQLGNGGGSNINAPTLTSSLGVGRTAVALSAGESHTCAILDDGNVSCWGEGLNGRLGYGGWVKKRSPTLTNSLGANRTAVAIAAGNSGACALLDDGNVSCWGKGDWGLIGNGGTAQQSSPTLTSSLGVGRTAVAITAGWGHRCALLDNGSVSCWGLNSNGQGGNGSTPSSLTTPTLVSSLGAGRTAVAISAGKQHTCAILDNGSVTCWGNGLNGQLGNGGLLDKGTPTPISGGNTFNNSTGIPTPATWEIEPALPAGMSIAGGIISGTPSVYATNQTYTVYANQSGYSTTIELWFTVDTVNPHTVVDGQTIDAITFHTPFWNGTTSWSVTSTPSLPANLVINAATGEITGTMNQTLANTPFTVTATHNGSATQAFSFNLESLADYDGDGLANDLPIGYNSAEQPTPGLVADSDDDGDGLADTIETGTGNYIDATDTGTEPLDPDTDDDGVCDGPNAVPPICLAGPDLDPNGVLPPATLVGVNNTAITTLAPYIVLSGGTYEISPSLPATLSLDASTGEISGTPTEALANSTFTVWVNHSDSTSLSWNFTVEILVDTDGDGMPNELPINYDPSNPDAPGLVEDTDDDADGLLDNEETNGTDSTNPDSDGDGMCDGPNAVAPDCIAGPDAFPTDPSGDTDTDGDGKPDTLNPPSSSDPALVEDFDDDGDGLEDVNETNTGIDNGPTDKGTDPLDPDTDDDGICDGPNDVLPICVAGPDATPFGEDATGVVYGLNNSQFSSLVPPYQLPNAAWEISPDLPLGMSIDPVSGIISGTPTEIIDNTTFIIYGNASSSTITFDFNLQILEDTDRDGEPNQLPIDYPIDGTLIEDLDDDGDGASDLSETGTGFYNGTDDMGTDPLDPDTDDDGICDGPNDVLPQCIGGPDSNPFGTGPLGPTVLVNNSMTTPIPPANAVPGAVWEISPALPEGLVLDASTGTITGTPTQAMDNTTFTLWANTTTPSMSIVSTFWLEVLEDSDGDGMPDTLPEDYPDTNPPYDLVEDLDDDNDGMSDEDEGLIGTDPTDPDTDGDGFCDGNGTGDGNCFTGPDSSPLDKNLPVNTDGDAYPDIDPDGEGGLIADDDDDNDGFLDTQEIDCSSDPLNATDMPQDLDMDGICDTLDDDIDGDGLFNVLETNTGIYHSSIDIGTDPHNADTDGDGVCDGPESPVTSNCTAGPDAFPNDPAAHTDTDGDGFPDELFGNSTSIPMLVLDLDDDGDDWSDLNETACGTDILDDTSTPVDTDADGICDALDDLLDLPFSLTYPSQSIELTVGQEMTTFFPNITGLGDVGTWELSGELPEGLTFGWSPARDALLDGSIRGTPVDATEMMNFTIWANNSAYSQSFDFSMTVVEEITNGGNDDGDDVDDGFSWVWCFPFLIILLIILLVPLLFGSDKILLLLADGPEPENTTSSPPFLSGAGTKEDPFVLKPITGLSPGGIANSVEVITIDNMSDIKVKMIDLNQESNGDKFNMFEAKFGDLGTRLIGIGSDGEIVINIKFDDSKNTPTFEGGEFSGLLKLGRASVYISWSVTVRKDLSQKEKFETAAKKAAAENPADENQMAGGTVAVVKEKVHSLLDRDGDGKLTRKDLKVLTGRKAKAAKKEQDAIAEAEAQKQSDKVSSATYSDGEWASQLSALDSEGMLGDIVVERLAEEAKVIEEKIAKENKIKADADAKEAKIAEEKAAKEAKAQAVKDAKEAKIAEEKAAKEAKAQAAKDAKDAKMAEEKAVKEAKAQAAKDAKDAKMAEEKAVKEAKAQVDKDAKEAKMAEEKAVKTAKSVEEKYAKDAKMAEEKAAKAAKTAEEKYAKDAKMAEEKAAKAAKAAEEKYAKDAKVAEEKAAKDAKVAEEKAAKEAKVAEEKAAKSAKTPDATVKPVSK